MTTPSELEAQIRFGLADLSARNGAHQFEAVCRHFAQARLVSNVLPATGPVAAGGDQGRDAETFRSFLAEELGPQSAFLARVSEGPVACACTLQQDNVQTKIRSDLKKITSSGTEVVHVYVFLAVALAVGARHDLQAELKDHYGVDVDIFDQHGLAAQLADPELFWIAAQYLSIPAAFAPERAERPDRPSWYQAELQRWRERGAPRPLLPDILDARMDCGMQRSLRRHGPTCRSGWGSCAPQSRRAQAPRC